MKLFICRFAQQWEDFRLPELESVARIQNVQLEINPSDYSNEVIQYSKKQNLTFCVESFFKSKSRNR